MSMTSSPCSTGWPALALSHEEIERFLASGQVRVDGQRVTDPYHPAANPATVVIALE